MPFPLRCGAFLIDYIVLITLVVLGTLFARMLGGGARAAGNSAETAAIALVIVVTLFNLGVLPGLTGLTLGKWATGLRIQRVDSGNPGIGRALLRHFVGYPLSLVTGRVHRGLVPGWRRVPRVCKRWLDRAGEGARSFCTSRWL